MHNRKMKVTTRNNLLRKLSNSKWGANASTIRTTALALCYSVADVVHGLGDRPWTTWRCLNRLRTGFTCSKEQRQRWQYYEGVTTCECGLATENTAHMMQCTLLEQPCSLDDLNKFNDTEKKCVERWKTLV